MCQEILLGVVGQEQGRYKDTLYKQMKMSKNKKK